MRLVIGVMFGVGVFAFGWMAHLSVPSHPSVLDLEIYFPIRWIEWSIIAAALAPRAEGGPRLLIGASNPSRAWRLGGIVVSILADVPVMFPGGFRVMLPVGRFLC